MISFVAALALAGALGTPQPSVDIDRVEWSNYCFVAVHGERTNGIVERRSLGSSTWFTNAFREQSTRALNGTYRNGERATFDAIVSYVGQQAMETVRPERGGSIDGCAGFLSVTRGSTTTTISEFSADGPEYERFDAMLIALDHIAEHQAWRKVSDHTRIMPVMPGDLY